MNLYSNIISVKSKIPGLILSTFLGFLSMAIAYYLPVINAIVVALILGMIIGNMGIIHSRFDPGIYTAGHTLLELSIVILGFGIQFQDVSKLGWSTVMVLIINILLVLWLTYYISKKWLKNPSMGFLIGFGTAICGTSAIAALAPKLNARQNEVGVAIAVVNVLGVAGMVILPLALNHLQDVKWIGLMIGGSLHGVSNVVGSGYAMSKEIGDLAITIKLGRVALLAPALIFFSFLTKPDTQVKSNLRLPLYLIGFILASMTVSLFDLPEVLLVLLNHVGNALLVISLVAIAMRIQLNHLIADGRTAILFGIIIFLFTLLVVGLLGLFLNI